jgi:hypothetical protein
VNFDGVIWHDSNHCEVIALRLSTELNYNAGIRRTRPFEFQVSEYAIGKGVPAGWHFGDGQCLYKRPY